MTSTLPPLVQALSGALGSATANNLTYPLDLVNTRVQLAQGPRKKTSILGSYYILRQIIRKHGLYALYDGIASDTCATLLSNFFYFYFYAFLRSLLTRKRVVATSKSRLYKPSVLEELALGFIAGVASRALSTPLNILTVQLQTERDSEDDVSKQERAEKGSTSADVKPSNGFISAVVHIYEEHGLGGFWRGFSTTTLLSLNPSFTLALFQLFRRALAIVHTKSSPGVADPKPGEAFLGAAVANSVAVVVLYPLILAKTRLQCQSPTSPFRKLNSLTAVLDDAWRKNTMYQGLEMQVVKGFLSQGVTFLVKGRIEQGIVKAYLKRRGMPAA